MGETLFSSNLPYFPFCAQNQTQNLPGPVNVYPPDSVYYRAQQLLFFTYLPEPLLLTYTVQACYYNEDTGAPLFAPFFEDQAEVKREHGKQFLRYLRRRGCKICLPVIKRPDIGNWATGIKALECALEMENELTKLLQDLKVAAYEKSEKDLVRFLGKYLDKQKRNTSYLEHQIAYHKNLEEKQAQEEDPFKKPAEASGKD